MIAERSERTEIERQATTCSVVILNYNYARFLATTITSALDQTRRPVEVIVVDDASTDDSASVIAGFGDSITVITHRTNLGQGAAINSGANAATGDLVWFLDADDALLPDACATAVSAYENDGRIAKFHTPLAVVDGDGRWSGQTVPANPDRLAEGDIASHVFRFRAHGWPPMSGNAYAAGALRKVLPIPAEAYRQAADSFLNEQIAICGPLARTDRPVAVYRQHGSNQFADRPLDVTWLRTKIDRELCSHRYLGYLAERIGRTGYRQDPNEVLDVSFLGYRMASLRLDAAGHPAMPQAGSSQRPDSRLGLAVVGVRAAWANSHLARSDRVIRSLWFLLAAAAPRRAVPTLFRMYVPDGPSQPIWRRRRRQRNDADQSARPTMLIHGVSDPHNSQGGHDVG